MTPAQARPDADGELILFAVHVSREPSPPWGVDGMNACLSPTFVC